MCFAATVNSDLRDDTLSWSEMHRSDLCLELPTQVPCHVLQSLQPGRTVHIMCIQVCVGRYDCLQSSPSSPLDFHLTLFRGRGAPTAGRGPALSAVPCRMARLPCYGRPARVSIRHIPCIIGYTPYFKHAPSH